MAQQLYAAGKKVLDKHLNTDYLRNKKDWDTQADRVIYTGPIDAYDCFNQDRKKVLMCQFFNNNSHKQDIVRFFVSVFIFILLALLLRLLASSTAGFTSNKAVIIIYTSICTSLILALWNYEKKIILAFALFSFLYVVTALIKLPLHIPLHGKEITDAFCLGNLSCCLILLPLRYLCNIKSIFVKIFCYFVTDILIVIALLIPVFIIGYYILCGEILTATIILTLFQTNTEEVIGYLKDKDLFLWGATFFCALLANIGFISFVHRVRTNNRPVHIVLVSVLTFIVIFIGFKNHEKFRDCYAVNILIKTKQALNDYKAYGKASEFRKQNLQNLKGLSIAPGRGGMYVLVIGESVTRDHMHAYGYEKETTPWLTQMCNGGQSGVLLFANAYANHTPHGSCTYLCSEYPKPI